jgi:hypothetical protein
MTNIQRILLLALLQSSAANAANAAMLDTNLFTLEVPDQWQIEDNKTNLVLVIGNKIVDGVPLPSLSIQYCMIGDQLKPLSLSRCDKPCTERSLDFLFNEKKSGLNFSQTTSEKKPNGIIEYSAKVTHSGDISAMATLSCSSTGQAYISLVSDQPKEKSEELFSIILRSLKWK